MNNWRYGRRVLPILTGLSSGVDMVDDGLEIRGRMPSSRIRSDYKDATGLEYLRIQAFGYIR